MALTSFEREALVMLRDMQLERRRAETSFDRIVPVDDSIGPTLDIKYSKKDHYVEVARWRTGNPRFGSANFVGSDDTIKLGFFGSSITQSWWEKWLKQNATKTPNQAAFPNNPNEFFNMRLAMQAVVNEIERDIDNAFYAGRDDIGWDGLLGLDASPESLSQDLSTEVGRQEFISAIRAARVTAKNPGGDDRRVQGRLVLAIDSSLTPYLEELYDIASGNERTAREYVDRQVAEVIEVENANMAGKAILHWQDPENIVMFDATPNGVELVAQADPNIGQDDSSKIFYLAGWHEFRANSVKEFDSLAPA